MLSLEVTILWFSGEEVESRSDGGTHTDSDKSGKSSPVHVVNIMTEMFVSEENLNKMEDILDTWSNNLKVCVASEMPCLTGVMSGSTCIEKVLIPTRSWEFIRYTYLVHHI